MPHIDVIIVYGVIIFIIVTLYFDLLRAGFTFLIGVTVLGIFGILTPKEMLIGASNEQIVVIILLLLIGNILRKTSVLRIAFDKIFYSVKTSKEFISRIMILIAPLSAFLNNTPLVALTIPYAYDWSIRRNQPISKLLLPISYAAIIGGCATLIGTSTNLIVNGMTVEAGLPSLKLFDFSYVGIPMIIIGFLYMYFIGHKLLPSNFMVSKEAASNNKKFFVETEIIAGSNLIDKTVLDSGIRALNGLYLFQIIRDNIEISEDIENVKFQINDILLFTGQVESVTELLEHHKGLRIPTIGMYSKKYELDIVEIVISDQSSLDGKTIKSENFRSKYDATVIAIHRNGENISGIFGDIKLKPGDAILLLVGDKFVSLSSNSKDFYIISKVKEIRKLSRFQSIALILGLVSAILFSALGFIQLFIALVILISFLLVIKVTNPKELAQSIDYDLAFIIAMSLALGVAMQKTGVAEILANIIIEIFEPLGAIGLLSGIYFITAILAAFVTNKAAVALIFPIVINIANDMSFNPVPFILTVSFAAAANFMTPIGYQTNTMVYGPGGYKFKDFIRVGTPLTIIYGIVTIIIMSFMYF